MPWEPRPPSDLQPQAGPANPQTRRDEETLQATEILEACYTESLWQGPDCDPGLCLSTGVRAVSCMDRPVPEMWRRIGHGLCLLSIPPRSGTFTNTSILRQSI